MGSLNKNAQTGGGAGTKKHGRSKPSTRGVFKWFGSAPKYRSVKMESVSRHIDKKIKKHNTKCYVKGCNSNTTDNPELSFHTIPPTGRDYLLITSHEDSTKAIDAREIWLERMQTDKVLQKMHVCSLHFLPEDFILPGKFYFCIKHDPRIPIFIINRSILHQIFKYYRVQSTVLDKAAKIEEMCNT